MSRRIIVCAAALVLIISLLAGCNQTPPDSTVPTPAPTAVLVQTAAPAPTSAPAEPPDDSASYSPPKYIFLFIGDGMSFAQIQAAQYYKGSDKGNIAASPLNFMQFPVTGTVTNYNVDSIIPDSASAGTSIACGVKTENGVLGQTADGASVPNIAELLKADGKKIGIVTSVTLNNATPAAFYAHSDARSDYEDITRQMAQSGFDYFGGGAIYTKAEDDNIARDYSVFEQQGYTIANTKEEIESLNSDSGKVYAISPTLANLGAIPFVIDAKEDDLTLADFVGKGIEVLDNDNGFFMMCESGKIDWACHANDAASVVQEMLDFEDAIQQAVDFAALHPDETLILVTADHETGGMSLGYTATQYSTNLDLLDSQNISYSLFKDLLADMIAEDPDLELSGVLPVMGEDFGLYTQSSADKAASKTLVLSDYEYGLLKSAFAESVESAGSRTDSDQMELLYGGYDPLTTELTRILNNKAGVSWTTFYHTALPIPVYAYGAGAEAFGGSYDNTGVFEKLVEVCGLEDQITQ